MESPKWSDTPRTYRFLCIPKFGWWLCIEQQWVALVLGNFTQDRRCTYSLITSVDKHHHLEQPKYSVNTASFCDTCSFATITHRAYTCYGHLKGGWPVCQCDCVRFVLYKLHARFRGWHAKVNMLWPIEISYLVLLHTINLLQIYLLALHLHLPGIPCAPAPAPCHSRCCWSPRPAACGWYSWYLNRKVYICTMAEVKSQVYCSSHIGWQHFQITPTQLELTLV